jgi:hypothetical protein
MSQYRLSKSKILSGIQCPKRLYLEVHHPELAVEDEELARRFSIGHQVGEVAQQLCPDGKLIEYDDGLSRALEETQLLLREPPKNSIFEATFAHDGVLIRADLLGWGEEGYRLTEVKASTSVKDYHYVDCAIQSWVMEGEGYPLEHIELAHIDNNFIYPGGGDYRGLLHHEDITEGVMALRDQVPGWVENCKPHLAGEMPKIETGSHCTDPFDCPFYDYCSPEEGPEYPVSALPRGGKVAEALLAEGIEDIRDIPEGYLRNENHERVRRITASGQPELDPEAGKYLRSLPYPRRYLDFETIQFAVPIWAGTRPYRQLPFQWSCHVEDEPGKLRHAEFLYTSGNAPMRPLDEKLLATLGDDGPIFVYGSFEKTRLTELAEMFPDLSDGLDSLIGRLVDILPLTRRSYYHPEMKGSWSIKAVLPNVAPELNYEDLEEVQHGAEAQLAYLETIDPATATSRHNELKNDLLEYCKMDTLALVKLAYFLQGAEI